MSPYPECRYCGGAGCLACEGEGGRPDAPALTQGPTPGRRDPLVDTHPISNPCVRVFGDGPAGTSCATCSHLQAITYSRTYYKCDQRPYSAGPGTDHRQRWPACSRYAAGPTQQYGGAR